MRPLVRHLALPLSALCLLAGAAGAQQSPGYRVTQRLTVGGEGGWDYLAVDTANNRLFITRGDRVEVVDPATGKQLGTIPGLNRAHGVAFDYAHHRGFATSGEDSTVVMFNLATLRVLGRIPASMDDDAISFDPVTGHIFTFNGDAESSTVIDPVAGRRIATIDLGAKPEEGTSAGTGKVYVNLASANQIADIDARTQRVTRKWSLPGCTEPTSLAVDAAHDRLFSGCRNRVMAISDTRTGREIATVPVGQGVDGGGFDATTGNAFTSNGEGSITVVHEDSPSHFSVVETIPTMRGARTMTVDPRTHRLYTISAQFGQPAAGQRRPPTVPGTFTVLVIGR